MGGIVKSVTRIFGPAGPAAIGPLSVVVPGKVKDRLADPLNVFGLNTHNAIQQPGTPTALPDDAERLAAVNKAIADMRLRSGRMSTILSQAQALGTGPGQTGGT
jgi:hypothetical protein